MTPVQELQHVCLTPARGAPVESASITDRGRLALTLQAACLLAHLRIHGWRLSGSLEAASVEDGRLCGLVAQPGVIEEPTHQQLREFLLRRFRCENDVPGRGQARRSARRLVRAWAHPLAPLSSDELLRQIFEAAPFLFNDDFAVARLAFLGQLNGRVSVVGPGRFQRQLHRQALSEQEPENDLERLVCGPSFHDIWNGVSSEAPMELLERGRWTSAVSAFRVHGATGAEEKRAFARSLIAIGKFEQALTVLDGDHSVLSGVLRVQALTRLHRWRAAKRWLVRAEKRVAKTSDLLKVADPALRTFANLGEPARIEFWRQRLAGVRAPADRNRADAILAASAFDTDEASLAKTFLERSRDLADDPVHGWWWHYADGLRALSEHDARAAETAFRTALGDFRRQITPLRACLLWTNLLSAFEAQDDLERSEWAARTAYRLGIGFEGPLPMSVLLYNLVETLLKRGDATGARELLDFTHAKDREAGNVRALAHNAELAARYHMTQGRPDRAARVVDERLLENEDGWRRNVLLAWSARAHGLKGRTERARRKLASGGLSGLSVLDPEELPAVWVFAGDRAAAIQAASDTGSALWQAALGEGIASDTHWRELDRLDLFRSARLVRDLERAVPGFVPRAHRVQAIRRLRQLGLARMAADLEESSGGAWEAVSEFLDPETGGDVARLFAEAGYEDARLEWDGPDASVVVNGAGGEEREEFALPNGRLILDAIKIDGPLRVLLRLVGERFRRKMVAQRRPAPNRRGGIVGESETLQAALDLVARFARQEIPILILGETGTGKELVANWAHQISARGTGPFMPVNCAALPESLLLSELFGHVQGAFTGATRDRVGHFEAASGGTVFLDEIGDLPLDAQGRFLRLLQESEIMRLGESRVRKVDTRVIAATHRDLNAMIDDGVFRQDLFYRLNIGRVALPPLRDRGNDLTLLVNHFLARWSTAEQTFSLNDDARRLLRRYHWPGNVRELENVLRRGAALTENGIIAAEHLEFTQPLAEERTDFQSAVDSYRRRLLVDALERSGGNQAEAARYLGLTRQALSYWIKKLGLRV